MLDIGGSMGAAVVLTPPELEGSEIEIRRPPAAWDGTHVAVRKRPTPGPPIYAAVFAPLHHGAHQLRLRGARPDATVLHIDVAGGEVSETTWSDQGDISGRYPL
ncbi:MAG TPA: hypothetical protein VNV87_18755 [Acidimicrobiales bacterium]|nr:hypothetical protein [Acidimicrobiales bacterium]